MHLKLLAVGDMHLGRRPSRLPAELTDQARNLGPAEAWIRVVDAAIEEGVDAVVLAGDVVDRSDDFFEAYRQLLAGVERLAAEDIRILGVVGDHDVKVLPQLAQQIEAFELLGEGGTWQATEICADNEAVTIWGWSFPTQQVSESPLPDLNFERGNGPNIGLLHCDRDQTASPYAPVSSSQLEATGMDGWLLGHIHKPDVLTAPNPSGYLGSLTGLNVGETGARGPWLLVIEDGRIAGVEQWVLAPLRWELMEVDIGGISKPEEARDRLLDCLRDLDEKVSACSNPPKALGLRVCFVGPCRHGSKVMALLSESDREQIHIGERGTHYFIEKLEVATRPEISLEELAKHNDPPGLLAQ
jgi:exonuclease SbcD